MRLRGLIEEMCPAGVPFMRLEELLDYEQPGKYLVASTDYDDSYPTPVLTAGRTFVLGYTDEVAGIYPASADTPVIIFDDFTTAFKWVDFPFKAKSSAMKMITLKTDAPAILEYVYHAMRCVDFAPRSHARQWIGTYSQFRVPVPPVDVQQGIVEVLGRLQALELELESELHKEVTARRIEYGHHRDSVLAFPDDNGVQWSSLAEIATNLDSKRRPVTRSARIAGDIAYYGASGIVDYVSDYIFDGDYLLVSEDGANLLARSTPIAFSISGKAWVNNHAHVLEFPTEAERRFVEIYLNSIDLAPFVTGGAQAKLSQTNLNRIPIPVLPVEEQERIVSFLDTYKAQVDDLALNLTAESAGRRRQYEHYRGRLLTFSEVA